MSKTENATLQTWTTGTDEIDITRTVKLKLETSQRKNRLLRKGIEAYQQVLSGMADVLPSYPDHEWEPHHTHMYHHAQEFLPDDNVDYRTTLAQVAQQQVAESFKSWRERGKPGDNPRGEFGNGSYLGLRAQELTVEENESGWGIKTNFISYKPVWFHIEDGVYQRDFLRRITNDDDPCDHGSAELHLHDTGEVYAHLTVTWPVEVYTVDDVTTTVGVDLNDDPLAVAAVVDGSEVEDVCFISGSEFRHHRERVKRKRAEAMADGNLKAIKDSRLMYQRYTDHVTNEASRRVVDLAVEHSPASIHLEDLTHLRETVTDPIHDWPYAELQTKIAYKAAEEGIPVRRINPEYTSVTCRKCGETNPAMRDGREFNCWECGYEVHADVNAAINIANRGGD